MLGLPWWAWLLLLVVGVLFVGSRARTAWRAGLRREFTEYLRREAPEVAIVAEREGELDLRMADGSEGTLRLDRFYAEGSAIPAEDEASRRALFAHFVKVLREGPKGVALVPEQDRPRVRPRLVNEAFLARLRGDLKKGSIPAIPSGVDGLSIVFVLDSEASVAYVTADHLRELDLTDAQALELAKENLARTFDGSAVRRALEDGSLNVVKGLDTYDAARLLLVSRHLQPGEQVAALVPDRDTLVITRPLADGDWSGLRKLAKAADGDPLWREPLLVTSTGISPPTTRSSA